MASESESKSSESIGAEASSPTAATPRSFKTRIASESLDRSKPQRNADTHGHDICSRGQHVEKHRTVLPPDRAFFQIVRASASQIAHLAVQSDVAAAANAAKPYLNAAAEPIAEDQVAQVLGRRELFAIRV